MRTLIHSFKYNQKTYLRHRLARGMIEFIERYKLDIQQFDWMIPVPLFPTRFRERGYNQATYLATIIGQKYNIKINRNILKRIKNTEFQTTLRRKERFTNIHRAFTIKHSEEVKDHNILIIDDLLTTGTTVSEAARTLKGAGAKTVGVLTLAITD